MWGGSHTRPRVHALSRCVSRWREKSRQPGLRPEKRTRQGREEGPAGNADPGEWWVGGWGARRRDRDGMFGGHEGKMWDPECPQQEAQSRS